MARAKKGDRIYLDHAATTPVCLESRRAMSQWLEDGYGNPSSLHQDGRRAKDGIDAAREVLSQELGCLFAEVLFTSGGTEAANLAILGLALNSLESPRKRVLLGAAEHHCVLSTEFHLRALGFTVELIPVDREARIDLQALEGMLDPDVLLVSTMHANNELGVVNPIRKIADLVHAHDANLHCDAVQTFHAPGRSWKVSDLDADLVTLSGHKIYAPKGVGAIYTRAGIKLKPLVTGGGQEREMRGGTENVAAIAGLAAAVKVEPVRAEKIAEARDQFLDMLIPHGAVPTVQPSVKVLPGHAHIRFPGIDAETILIVLDRLGVSASSGAACSSGSIEPSHVLLASGYSATEAKEGLRFTFGRQNTLDQATDAALRVIEALDQIRSA